MMSNFDNHTFELTLQFGLTTNKTTTTTTEA